MKRSVDDAFAVLSGLQERKKKREEDRMLVAIDIVESNLDAKIQTVESGEFTFELGAPGYDEYGGPNGMTNLPPEVATEEIYKRWEPILLDRGLFCIFRLHSYPNGLNVCWDKSRFKEKKLEKIKAEENEEKERQRIKKLKEQDEQRGRNKVL